MIRLFCGCDVACEPGGPKSPSVAPPNRPVSPVTANPGRQVRKRQNNRNLLASGPFRSNFFRIHLKWPGNRLGARVGDSGHSLASRRKRSDPICFFLSRDQGVSSSANGRDLIFQQQGSNMGAINIGISHNNYFMIS